MTFLLWLLAISLLLLCLRGVTWSLVPQCAFKAALFPGFLVAVLSRAAACGLSGAPLKAVNFPWREGEPVEHGPPKLTAGPVILALVPCIAGFAAVLCARSLLVPEVVCEATLRPMDAGENAVAVVIDTSRELVRSHCVVRPDLFGSWRALLFFWIAFSVLVFTAPSYGDWRILQGVLVAMLILVAGLDYLGIRAGFFSRAWFLQFFYAGAVSEAVGFLLLTTVVSLLTAAFLHGTYRFLRAALRPKEEPKPAE
ncbi:MAG: hypothetical protein ACUVYA_08390 [Planctomycetota bacterium]